LRRRYPLAGGVAEPPRLLANFPGKLARAVENKSTMLLNDLTVKGRRTEFRFTANRTGCQNRNCEYGSVRIGEANAVR
jgi:hypothetical protein